MSNVSPVRLYWTKIQHCLWDWMKVSAFPPQITVSYGHKVVLLKVKEAWRAGSKEISQISELYLGEHFRCAYWNVKLIESKIKNLLRCWGDCIVKKYICWLLLKPLNNLWVLKLTWAVSELQNLNNSKWALPQSSLEMCPWRIIDKRKPTRECSQGPHRTVVREGPPRIQNKGLIKNFKSKGPLQCLPYRSWLLLFTSHCYVFHSFLVWTVHCCYSIPALLLHSKGRGSEWADNCLYSLVVTGPWEAISGPCRKDCISSGDHRHWVCRQGK